MFGAPRARPACAIGLGCVWTLCDRMGCGWEEWCEGWTGLALLMRMSMSPSSWIELAMAVSTSSWLPTSAARYVTLMLGYCWRSASSSLAK
jgi:hypothetical protein